MSLLSIQQISKRFGQTIALNGISFEVEPGETLALLGPSGCGKSTLLNMIAGLDQPDSGDVLWEGKSLANTPPNQRGFGLMFQDYALFPHQKVFENVAFGLRIQRQPPQAVRSRVTEMLKLVDLDGFEKRDINTLSGGEAQRVALARSLAPQPRLLMLDEPLGALDRDLRERLAAELRQILKKINQTTIYVTHDQEEAFTLADRVVIMHAGQVEQIGAPQEIYRQPGSLFVARFLGLNNLLPGKALPNGTGTTIQTSLGTFELPSAYSGDVTVLIRPDQASLDGKGSLSLSGILRTRSFRGAIYRVSMEIKDSTLSFDFPPNALIPPEGSTIQISLDPQHAVQVIEEAPK